MPSFSFPSMFIFPFSLPHFTPTGTSFLGFHSLRSFQPVFVLLRSFFPPSPFTAFSNSFQGGRISGKGARGPFCTSSPETCGGSCPGVSCVIPILPAPPTPTSLPFQSTDILNLAFATLRTLIRKEYSTENHVGIGREFERATILSSFPPSPTPSKFKIPVTTSSSDGHPVLVKHHQG